MVWQRIEIENKKAKNISNGDIEISLYFGAHAHVAQFLVVFLAWKTDEIQFL